MRQLVRIIFEDQNECSELFLMTARTTEKQLAIVAIMWFQLDTFKLHCIETFCQAQDKVLFWQKYSQKFRAVS